MSSLHVVSSTQAVAKFIQNVAASDFWIQLKAAPGQATNFLLDNPVVMMVIVIIVMLVATLSKHKPR